MPDSGITNMPPGAKEPGTPVKREFRGGRKAAKVERMPDDFREVRQPRKVKGEVIRVDKDGSVRIRVAEGEIDIRLQNANLRVGDKVEVEIPAGQPPGEVHVRRIVAQSSAATLSLTETPVTLDLGGEIRALPEVIAPPSGQRTGTGALPEIQPGQSFRMLPVAFSQIELVIPQQLDQAFKFSMQSFDFNWQSASFPASNGQFGQGVNILPQPIDSIAQKPDMMFLAKGAGFSILTDKLNLSALGESQIWQSDVSAIITHMDTVIAKPVAFQSKGIEPAFITGQETSTLPQRPQMLDVKILEVKLPSVKLAISEDIAGSVMSEGTAKPLLMKNTSPVSINAEIIGMTPGKLPVISMTMPQTGALQTFVLQTPAEKIVPGTELELMPYPNAVKGGGQIATEMPPITLSQFMQPAPWPVMEELAQVITQQSPQIVQAFAQVMPSPASPAQMVPAVMFFIAAVRSGDIASWLGEKAIEALKRDGKGSLLNRLGSELSNIGRVRAEPVSQDWRGLPVPLAYQDEIHKAAFYYRHGEGNDNDDDADGKGKPTRFIFELSLSKMGEVQIDGLLQGRRLDLAMRTQKKISQPMQHEMRKVYAGAISETGFEGEIIFQDDPGRWVRVIQEDKVLKFSS